MAQRSKHHNIWIIFQVRYPQICPEEKPTSIEQLQELLDDIEENLSLYDEDKISEFYSAKELFSKLRKQDDSELRETANTSLTVIENDHPLNQGDYLATDETYHEWLSYEYLKVDEAAALAVGRNPGRLKEILCCDELALDNINRQISDTIRILKRRGGIKKRSKKVSREDFLAWVHEYGSEHAVTIQKIAAATKSKKASKENTRRKSAVTNERNKMLELIIGTAMTKYRHYAKASMTSTAVNIRKSVKEHGVKISDDTVRKYLSEAAELL